jgi:serine phosphatase RsbU (regulator of sigma subunit)
MTTTLVRPAPSTAIDALSPPLPIARALRLASWGLVRAGRARAEAALADVEQAPAGVRAPALVAVAEVRRRANDWQGASALLRAAADVFGDVGQTGARAAALALAVDGDVHRGALDEAAISLAPVVEAGGFDGNAAAALVDGARGHALDGRQKLRAVPDDAGCRWSNWVLDLVRAEVLLEMGALAGAEQALARVVVPHALRFSELALRALWLRAQLELATATTRRKAGRGDDVDAARTAVTRLHRYAAAFPLYRAHAAQAQGELALLRGDDASTSFARAAHDATEAGIGFTRARLLARQAVLARTAVEARTQQDLDRARTALLEAGASARAGTLVPKAAVERGTQRRSIAVRLEQGMPDAATSNEQGLEAVVEVSRYLASIRDLPTLLEKTLEAVVRVLRAERGALLSVEGDGTLRCVAARGLKVEDVKEGSSAITFGVVRTAQETGEAVLSDNALSDERFKGRQSVVATDIRSVVCSPIRTRNRTFGFLYLDRRVLDVSFQAEQQELLAAICVQVAVAWENALAFGEIETLNTSLEGKVKERTVELRETNEALARSIEELTNTRLKLAEAQRDALEKEMTLARDIQRTILPAEETFDGPGVRLFGKVIPASFCGGDWWAWARIDDARSLLVVADVTGHGVASSLITAVARACLDTLSLTNEAKGPQAVLRAMNDVIHGAAMGQLMATGFAVVVDRDKKQLVFASAGHNPPWHVDVARGAAAPLMARGQRLGEAKDATFDEATVPWNDGDRLVLYTDGIVEWPGPKGKAYGDRRFRKSLEANCKKTAAEIVEALHADAAAFAEGTERDDDLTLVAVELRA